MIRAAVAFAAALSALVAVPSAAIAKAPARTAAARDWSRVVGMTPEGGYRLGNPAARVKIVGYGSLACPHCRHFEQTGLQPLLQKYVRTGQASFEFRNLLLNGPDLAVSLLTRCSGASNFFPMSRAVFAAQPQWEERIQQAVNGLSDAQKAELEAMNDQQRIVRYAELGNLAQLGARFGITPARARQCLTDKAALQRLLDMTAAANKLGVDHTPTFFINGKLVDAASWEQLDPLIPQAGARG